MNALVPTILSQSVDLQRDFPLEQGELVLLARCGKVLEAGFPPHAMLDLWNAAVLNLRRRAEAYNVQLFLTVIKDIQGRRVYNASGDTISERWSGIDDSVLIEGCSRAGIIDRKAAKILETINWMRNHASSSHPTTEEVSREDIIAFALQLQSSLFATPLPDPATSVSAIFDPVKQGRIDRNGIEILEDQVKAIRPAEVKTCFGFLFDMICKGEEPALDNAKRLWPIIWSRAHDELKMIPGQRYQGFLIEKSLDDSPDGKAKDRILEALVEVQGIKFIPDGARATIYRKLAKDLRTAKDAAYGWEREAEAARALAQLGPHVPNIAFEELYREIVAVWCGNYWGRSSAHQILRPFIETLPTDFTLRLIRLFLSDARATAELGHPKPKARALEIITELEAKLTLSAHIDVAQKARERVAAL